MKKSIVGTLSSPLALSVILGGGATVVWAAVCLWLGFVVSQIFFPSQPNQSLVFTLDGRALIQLHSAETYASRGYRTLDGQIVESPDDVDLQRYSSQLPAAVGGPPDPLRWYSRVVGFYQGNGLPTYWYLVHDGLEQGHAYFVGYDRDSKGKIGYIGLRGFRSDIPPEDEQFAIDGHRWAAGGSYASPDGWLSMGQEPIHYPDPGVQFVDVISGDSLFEVDLRRHTVRPIAMPDKVISVGLVGDPLASEFARIRHHIAVRLPDRVVLLNADREPLRSIGLPQPLREKTLTIYETTTQHEAILVDYSYKPGKPTEIFWLDQSGNVRRHEEVVLYSDPPVGRELQAWGMAAVFPSPLIQGLIVFVMLPREAVKKGDSPDYSTAVVDVLTYHTLPLLVVCLLAAALAVATYRHARRYGQTHAPVWAMFVLLTGVPGLIGYLLHCHWPATERCAQCGATVPRDRTACKACNTDFPAPRLSGAEVFA